MINGGRLSSKSCRLAVRQLEKAKLSRRPHDFARGAFVIVFDDESRENEGDLMVAAEHTDHIAMAYLLETRPRDPTIWHAQATSSRSGPPLWTVSWSDRCGGGGGVCVCSPRGHSREPIGHAAGTTQWEGVLMAAKWAGPTASAPGLLACNSSASTRSQTTGGRDPP